MRLRIQFSKTEAMRYTGHLDLHRAWERAFRRAGLPLAYSQGYHPQPRLNLAAALPLGFTSACEILDAWLSEEIPGDTVKAVLERALPPGIEINSIEEVEDRLPALQNQVLATEYIVTMHEFLDHLDERLDELIKTTVISRERHGKTYDLRPLIEDLHRMPDDDQGYKRVFMRLTARSGATGRPEEVLAALDIPSETTRIHRTRLILEV